MLGWPYARQCVPAARFSAGPLCWALLTATAVPALGTHGVPSERVALSTFLPARPGRQVLWKAVPAYLRKLNAVVKDRCARSGNRFWAATPCCLYGGADLNSIPGLHTQARRAAAADALADQVRELDGW